MTDYPVLIVGAGPTGMALAAELNYHGIDFLIIDKRSSPITTSNAAAIHARTLECWHRRPWQSTCLHHGLKISGVSINAKSHQLTHFNFNLLKNTQYAFILSLPQNNIETILDEHLKNIGKPVIRNTTVLDFLPNKNDVTVRLSTPHGEKQVTANWVVGCDGYHSSVREKAGIQLIGTDFEERFLLVDAKIKTNLPKNEFHIYLDSKGILAFFVMPESTRIIAGIGHDPDFKNVPEPSLSMIEKIIKQRTTLNFTLAEISWKSHFWIHECIANKFKVNRIFIAGDAAHVHSPAGGQGMNTGIQDAYNLAWKLAYVIKHNASSSLLDSYELERRSNAKSVVDMTANMTRLANIKNPILLSLRNVIASWILKHPLTQITVINRLSQLSLSYKKNSSLQGTTLSSISPGNRALDCLMDDKTKTYLFDLLCDTHYHLLVFYADPEKKNRLDTLRKKYAEMLCIHFFDPSHKKIMETYRFNSFTLCLIRPDQYIAYLGNEISKLDAMISLSSS